MKLLGFYLELPWWLRTGIASSFLIFGVVIALLGMHNLPPANAPRPNSDREEHEIEEGRKEAAVGYRIGFYFIMGGALLLLTCGRSDAEKNGYNF